MLFLVVGSSGMVRLPTARVVGIRACTLKQGRGLVMIQLLEDVRDRVNEVTEIQDPDEELGELDVKVVGILGDSPADMDLKKLYTAMSQAFEARQAEAERAEAEEGESWEPSSEFLDLHVRTELMKSLFFRALEQRCGTYTTNVGIRTGFRVVTLSHCMQCSAVEHCKSLSPLERPDDWDARDWSLGGQDEVESQGENLFQGLDAMLQGIEAEIAAVDLCDLDHPVKTVMPGEAVIGELGTEDDDLKQLFTLFSRLQDQAREKSSVGPGELIARMFGMTVPTEPEEDGPECARALGSKANLLKDLFFYEMRQRFDSDATGLSINQGWVVSATA